MSILFTLSPPHHKTGFSCSCKVETLTLDVDRPTSDTGTTYMKQQVHPKPNTYINR